MNRRKSVSDLHDYWRNPKDAPNNPQGYTLPIQRSVLLFRYLRKYVKTNAKILELGCNVGRNLNFLHQKGYNNLSGIEINPTAIRLLKQNYPSLGKIVKLYNTPIESVVTKFKANEFDLLFTMAVLEHIHPKSEWIFKEMARISSKYLITIEDEAHSTWKIFKRNYKNIFEALGLKQLEEFRCSQANALDSCFILRCFSK